MNTLDIVVLLILVSFVAIGYKKGLAIMVLNFFRTIIALFLASQLYPSISKFLREHTGMYESLKNSIAESMGLTQVVQETTLKASTELIENLPIPEFIRNTLTSNNNPEYYKVLKVDSLEGYIAGYISNMIINSIALIIVFISVYVLMNILVSALNIVANLPIINSFNKLGGSLIGFLQGTVLIWVIIVMLTFSFSTSSAPEHSDIFVMLNQSTIAIHFYNTNVILNFITNVHI